MKDPLSFSGTDFLFIFTFRNLIKAKRFLFLQDGCIYNGITVLGVSWEKGRRGRGRGAPEGTVGLPLATQVRLSSLFVPKFFTSLLLLSRD